MEVAIIVIFVAGYVAIAFEHSLMVSKAATALLAGVLTWTLYIFSQANPESTLHALELQVAEIAQILFFLIGAMTIVELIDVHGGFDLLTKAIRTRKKVVLLWIIGLLTFFLSAALDNLTTSIVMVSLIGKLIDSRKDRLLFAGIIVIAANSGGAWSPIGDVTTTMLWIKDKFTPVAVMSSLFIPSLVSLLAPLAVLSFWLKGTIQPPLKVEADEALDSIETQEKLAGWLQNPETPTEKTETEPEMSGNQKLSILILGLACLIFVPIFKLVTHLPPFMGMMLSLGIMWIVTEIMHKRDRDSHKEKFSPANALERIDIPSMLFFLGILLAVGALQVSGVLGGLAQWLDATLPNRNSVVVIIGLLSAVVDNVPLVSGAIQMYDPVHYPELATPNHPFWQFLAYCAGTGGSVLIIGSAAGVAVMGIEMVEFFWYVKRISWLALIGYFAGVGVFLLMQ